MLVVVIVAIIAMIAHVRLNSHLVEKIYLRFLEEAASDVRRRCRDDVRAMTKYVTWNANTVSRADLRRMLSPIASDFCSRDNIMAGHISEASSPAPVSSHDSHLTLCTMTLLLLVYYSNSP